MEEEDVDDEDSSDEELEEIIEEITLGEDFNYPQISSMIIPSLERMRIVETSLERGLRDVEVEDNAEEHHSYGVQENYLAGKDYDSLGDGDYDNSSIKIETPRTESSLSMSGSSNPMMGQGGYPGSSKRDGKKYHSALETGSRDEERKKREKRMW